MLKNEEPARSRNEFIPEPNISFWGNDEVNTPELGELVRSSNWNRLNDIQGFYAGVYKNCGTTFLFCDRLGIYPLYYCIYDNRLFAAQRMLRLLETIPFTPTASKEGILSLLLFGHHISDETVFKEIRRCEGRVTLEFKGDMFNIVRTRWREPHIYKSNKKCSEHNYNKHLAEALVNSVSSAVTGQDKIIIPLSGGFDSRAVLGAALECVDAERIYTVTFGGKDTLDYRIGKIVARKAGVKNIAFPITDNIFEESFQQQRASAYGYGYSAFAAQPSEMMSYLIKEASEGHLSVWGAGGDAITGSHLHPSDLTLKPCDNFEDFAKLLVQLRSYVPLKDVATLLGLDEYEAIYIITRLLEQSCLDWYETPWQFLDAWDIFVRGRMELISVLPFSGQLWRCPHFSRKYFELMATQSFDEKINQGSYKRMLVSRYKSLFALPTKRFGGRPLETSKVRDLYWSARWKATNGRRIFQRLAGHREDGIGRNYGRDSNFLNSIEGRKRLRSSISILVDQAIVRHGIDSAFEQARRNTQIARILITLGYAFNR